MMRKTIVFLSNRKRELIIGSHLQCIFPENRFVQNTMHVSLSIHDQNNPAYKLHDHMIYSWIDKQVSPMYELTMPMISQSIALTFYLLEDFIIYLAYI